MERLEDGMVKLEQDMVQARERFAQERSGLSRKAVIFICISQTLVGIILLWYMYMCSSKYAVHTSWNTFVYVGQN